MSYVLKALHAVRRWFTKPMREALYVVAATVVAMLLSANIVAPDDAPQLLAIVAAVLAAVQGALQLLNLTLAETGRWFLTAGRAAIYGGAAVILPAAVSLGWLDADRSESLLFWLSQGLVIVASLLGLFNMRPDDDPPVEGIAPGISGR